MKHTLFLASSITHAAPAIAKHIRPLSNKRTVFISIAAEGEDGLKTRLSAERGVLETAGLSLFDDTITGKTPR